MELIRKYKHERKKTKGADRPSTQESTDSASSGMQSGTRSSIDSSATSTSKLSSARPSIASSSGFASASMRPSLDSTSSIVLPSMVPSSFDSTSTVPIVESTIEEVTTPMQAVRETPESEVTIQHLEVLDSVLEPEITEEKESKKSKGSRRRKIFKFFGRSKGKTLKDRSCSSKSRLEMKTAEETDDASKQRSVKRRGSFFSFFSRRDKQAESQRGIEDTSAQQEPLVLQGTSAAANPDGGRKTKPIENKESKTFFQRIRSRLRKRNTGQFYEHGTSILESPSPDGTERPLPTPPSLPNPKATKPPRFPHLGDSFTASFESDSLDKDYVRQPDTEEETLYTDTPSAIMTPSAVISPKGSDQFKF